MEGANYWFGEGFTNFYARRLLYRCGARLAPRRDDPRQLDSELAAYDASPLRATRLGDRSTASWKSNELEKLPYARGNAIALAVDREMMRVSGGHRSLDDLMRELVLEARAGGHVSVEGLLARFARDTSQPFVAKLRAAIVDGAPVPLALDVLAPCLRGAHETRPRATSSASISRRPSTPATRWSGSSRVRARPRPACARATRSTTSTFEMGNAVSQIESSALRRPDDGTLPARRARWSGDLLVFALADAAACPRVL